MVVLEALRLSSSSFHEKLVVKSDSLNAIFLFLALFKSSFDVQLLLKRD